MNTLSLVAKSDEEILASVVVYVEANPVSVLTDDKLRARFFSEIEANIARFIPDLATDKGRKAAEEEKRQSNIRHRSAVMKAAKEGLMKQCWLDEAAAKAIVTAITQGLIPNVTVNF